MAAPQRVYGMTGGQATNSYVAGTVDGGMGNTYHAPQHHVEKTFNNNVSGSTGVTTVNEVSGDTVSIGSGSIDSGSSGSGSIPTQHQASAATSSSPDIELMTIEDIQNLLTRERFSESVRKTFEQNGIDGKYFVNLLEDGIFDELGVTSRVDKMKIKTILEKHSKESS